MAEHDAPLPADQLVSDDLCALSQLIADHGGDCVILLDQDGRIEWINPAGIAALEIGNVDLLIGQRWACLWPADMRRRALDAVRVARAHRTRRFAGRCPTMNGRDRSWDVSVSPIAAPGQPMRLVAIARDVTAYRALATQLRHAATHDALTGLGHRRVLQIAVERMIAANTPFALVVLDFDRFKQINDTLGHDAGDTLLGTAASRLRALLRPEDAAARIGGDEFALLVVEDAQIGSAEQRIATMLSAISKPIRFGDRRVHATASAGVARFPADGAQFDDLLRYADAALYAAKADGRARSRTFDGTLRQELHRKLAMLRVADDALRHDLITPYYQPQICLNQGRMVGVEALLRWHGTDGHIHSPADLSDAFDDPELGPRLAERMLTRIIRDIETWRMIGAGCSVAINCAPVDVLDEAFADRLLRRLRKAAIPPSLIELEVTEDVLLSACPGRVEANLRQLSDAGLRIALDDFGTGYASLAHLKRFPVDVIKIDRSFIERMVDSQGDRAIVAAITNLANTLGIGTVAEGIETITQADLLRAMGCSIGQGYLYGRAEPAATIAARLAHFSTECQGRQRVAA